MNKLPSKLTSKVSSTIGSNRKMIEIFLIVLIMLNFVPYDVLDIISPGLSTKVKNMLGFVVSPVQEVMSYKLVKLLLFIALVVSVFKLKDMNLFFIIAIYFVMVGR